MSGDEFGNEEPTKLDKRPPEIRLRDAARWRYQSAIGWMLLQGFVVLAAGVGAVYGLQWLFNRLEDMRP